jgi:hypothetical protein
MKQYLIFLILFVFSTLIFGQTAPISFSNANYNWVHVAIDSTKIGVSGLNGKNHLFYLSNEEPLRNQGYLYNSLVNGQNAGSGAFIEKIDLNTGKALWKNFYDLTNSDENEYPSTLEISDQGNLQIVGYRNTVKNFIPIPGVWTKGLPVYREYDDNTGLLLQYDTLSKSDGIATELFVSFDRLKLYKEDEKYVQIYYIRDPIVDTTVLIKWDYYDLDGKFLFSKDYPFSYKDKFKVSMMRNSDKDVFLVTTSDDESLGISKVLFSRVNDSNELIFQVDISELAMSHDAVYISRLYENRIEIISENYYNNFNNDVSQRLDYYDFEGNHIDYYEIPRTLKYSIVTNLIDDKPLVAVCKPNNLQEGEIALFGVDASNTFGLLKTLKINNSHAFVCQKMFNTADNDIIMQGSYSPIISGGSVDKTNIENIVISFTPSNLGLTTSVKDELNNISTNIYPNPSSHLINIDDADRFDKKVSLTSISGHVQQLILQEGQIDVSALTSGIYIIALTDATSGKVYRQKVIKID